MVGKALHVQSVERIYDLKGRDENKPFIILISKLQDLDTFLIDITDETRTKLEQIWPAQVSLVLPCPNDSLEYLHRGVKTLAIRMPDNQELLELINKIGPLVAPSANPEGQPPATTIKQAKEYFGDGVDFYVDGGEIESKPSTLIDFTQDEPVILRQGVVKVTNLTI